MTCTADTADALARLVAEHASAGGTVDITAALLADADPATLAALLLRPETSCDHAETALRALWTGDEDQMASLGWSRTRVARDAGLDPHLQLLIAGYADRHLLALAGHASDPEVLATIVDVAGRTSLDQPLCEGSSSSSKPAPGTYGFHALEAVLERAHEDPTLRATLTALTVESALASLLRQPHGGKAADLCRYWGYAEPDRVARLILDEGDDEALLATVALGWASTEMRSRFTDWVCEELRTGQARSHQGTLGALYHAWGRLPASLQDRIRDAIRASPHVATSSRSEWLRSISTTSSELEVGADGDQWASMPLAEAATRLKQLGHKLDADAARRFVARPDVDTDLALLVARKSSHLWKGWLQLRSFDRAFVVALLRTSPGWLRDFHDVAGYLPDVLTSAVRDGSNEHVVEVLAKEHLSVLDDDQVLALPWDVLAAALPHSDRASRVLADRVAAVYAAPNGQLALLGVLATPAATQWPATDLLAAVGAAVS